MANEKLSKLLIDRGNLQRRTTFIPLNKIKGHVVPPDVVKFAQSLVNNNNRFICTLSKKHAIRQFPLKYLKNVQVGEVGLVKKLNCF